MNEHSDSEPAATYICIPRNNEMAVEKRAAERRGWVLEGEWWKVAVDVSRVEDAQRSCQLSSRRW